MSSNNKDRYNLTVIVPARDEEQNLQILLPMLTDYQVILVDGNSADNSFEIASNFKNVTALRQSGRGKGAALVQGCRAATTKYVCFIDADLAHDPKFITQMHDVACDQKYKHVAGSRMLGGSSELFSSSSHIVRLLGSLIINRVISRKFGVLITDAQNGFRLFEREFFLDLDIKSNHTTVEQEAVAKTLASGNLIFEIPTHEYARQSGDSKINVLIHGPMYVLTLLSFLFLRRKAFDPYKLKQHQERTLQWWR